MFTRSLIVEKLGQVESVVVYKVEDEKTIKTSSKKEFHENFKPLTRKKLDEINTTRFRNKLQEVSGKQLPALLRGLTRTVLPENRFDIQVMDENNILLLLYYPEIRITNTTGADYIIKELYVILKFVKKEAIFLGRTRMCLADIDITRTKLTLDEIFGNYVHSHYSPNLNNACLGKDTPLKELETNLRRGDFSYLTSFLVQLEDFLGWESLEGNPYYFFSTLPNSLSSFYRVEKDSTLSKRVNTRDMRDVSHEILSRLSHLEFNTEYASIDDVTVIIAPSAEREIDELIQEHPSVPVATTDISTGFEVISFEDFYSKFCLRKGKLSKHAGNYSFKGNTLNLEVEDDSIESLETLYNNSITTSKLESAIKSIKYCIKEEILTLIEDETTERKDYTRED